MNVQIKIFFCLACLVKLCFGGRVAAQGRVHGGTVAEDGFLPYMAVILKETLAYENCAGVIVAPQWILTTAHCMFLPIENMKIGTGGAYWTTYDTKYSVEELVPHPFYNRQSKAHDIGLIKLDRPIAFNERTLPITMAQDINLRRGAKLMIAGRGVEKQSDNLFGILRTADVMYIEREECLKLAVDPNEIHNEYICTETRHGAGGCAGDSGGPLVYKNVLVGIISFGYNCHSGAPLVHASVARYYDWITNIINGKNVS